MTFWLDTQSFLLSFPSIFQMSSFSFHWLLEWTRLPLRRIILELAAAALFLLFFICPPSPYSLKRSFSTCFFFLYEKILVYSIHILLHTVKMQVMISCLCPFGTSDIVPFKYLRKNVCNWAGIINTTLYIYRERDNYTLLTCDLLLIWFACSWF